MISSVIAFATSVIGLLPQIYKALKTKSTKDLSMIMLLNYLICSLAWVIYAMETAASVVLMSNILGFVISFVLVILKYHYDRKTV